MSVVADRYALALFEICQKKSSQETTLETLKELSQAIVGHEDIQNALNSPMVSSDDKVSILKTALQNAQSEEIDGFLNLLSKNNRISELPNIANAFEDMVHKESGVMTGEVRSAIELSEAEKNNLKTTIEEKLSKKITLTYVIDKNVIGGFEAKVGSYIFEDSIKSHMQKLNDFITRRTQ